MTFFHILRLWHRQTNLKEGLVLYRYNITRRAGLLAPVYHSTLLCVALVWLGRIQHARSGQAIRDYLSAGCSWMAAAGRIVRLLWVAAASALSTNRIWHLQTNENEVKHMKKIIVICFSEKIWIIPDSRIITCMIVLLWHFVIRTDWINVI